MATASQDSHIYTSSIVAKEEPSWPQIVLLSVSMDSSLVLAKHVLETRGGMCSLAVVFTVR
jgi:hypothetical protein